VRAPTILLTSALLGLSALSGACTGDIQDSPGGGSGSTSATTGTGPGSTGPGSSTSSTGTSTTTGGAMCTTAPAPIVAQRVWRLSDEQYSNTVSDLLPGTTVPGITTPGRAKEEFINQSEQLPVTGALTSSLRTSVKAVASAVVMNLPGLLKCQMGQAEAACIEAFVDRFGARAFRRPIDSTEHQGLMAVYAVGAKTTSANGVRLIIEAILQSPSFLYRSELGAGALGQPGTLTPFELATALSFLIVDSSPDDQLWAAAQDGSVAMPAVFAQHVDRLMQTARGRSNTSRIYLKWLGLGAGVVTELSTTMYPEYDDAMRASMFGESSRFISGLVTQNGTLADMMTSRKTFVDARLAMLYGVPYSGTDFVETTLPEGRAGILTQAGVLGSKSRGHPIVIRGKFVRRDLFCMDIPPPPPNVDTTVFSNSNLTDRQQSTKRTENGTCGACHRLMDPLGIPFGKFDALSRYKPTEADGSPIDSVGEITLTDVNGPVSSPTELAASLGKSNDARVCISKKMLGYAIGRDIDDTSTTDYCETQRVATQVQTMGGHLPDLITAIARGPVFGSRTGGQ
jgi:hypothetical protein